MRHETGFASEGSRSLSQPLTPQPLYGQVRQALMEHIRNGEWLVGDCLPNETDLSRRFGVSVGTIRKAIEGLENSGLVKRIQGRGTYVAGLSAHVLKEKFTRLRQLDGKPLALRHELVSLSRARPAPEIASILDTNNDAIEVVQRLSTADGVVGMEVSWLRPQRLPNIERQFTFGQDLYAVLADYGLIVTRAQETLSLMPAPAAAAAALDIAERAPVATVARVAFALEAVPVEYRTAYYRLDRVGYVVELG